MQVTYDSQPAPGQTENEDLVVASDRFAVVLDGATATPGVETGCIHTVAWYVHQLGGQLAQLLLNDPHASLPDTLAAAMRGVCTLHAITCDLDNADNPSSTVAMVRETHTAVEVFVLADSPVVVRRRDGTVAAHCDDRIDHLPGYTPEIVRDHRNAPGGFWVAGSRPEAAYEALTTTIDRDAIEYAGLFSDGASRLVERHGRSWAELLTLLEQEGPAEVLRQVRTADAEAPADPQRHRGKTHDDATAVGCRFPAHCQ